MNEADFTLSRDWDFRDLTGWFWSEKFDGVRAYWDGAQLWTRGGNVINAPQSFLGKLPAGHHLDGELWAGKNTLSIASNAAVHGIWNAALVFKCFDAPSVSGNWLVRMATAKSFQNSIVQCVAFGLVDNREQPSEIAAEIISAGGEGAMFRNPVVILYERKRTVNLLRIKQRNLFAPWHDCFDEMRQQHARLEAEAVKSPLVGIDPRLFPFDPALSWNVRVLMSPDRDTLELVKVL